MASVANALSLPVAPKPTASCSSDHLVVWRLSPSSVSFRPSAELKPFGISVTSRSSWVRICASATPVMDKAASGASSKAPTIVDVDLGDRSYPIHIGSGLLDQPELLQRHIHGKRVLIVTNDTIAPLYLDKVVHALTVGNPNVSVDHVILPDGEKYKNMAIETGFGYGEWLHGEAVAAGIVMAVDMSHRLGCIDESIVTRIHNILKQAKLPTAPPETMTVEMFKSVMAVDKKVADGLLRLILLKGPLGNCVFTGDYDMKSLDETLRAFCKF